MTRPRRPCPSTAPGPRTTFLGALTLLTLSAIAAASEPSRMMPTRDLAVYVEYDGLSAHADAWQATAAHAMFEKTPAGAMTADVARQIIDYMLKTIPGARLSGAEILAIQDHIVRCGFSLGLYHNTKEGASGVLVLRGFSHEKDRERITGLHRAILGAETGLEGDFLPVVRVLGRDIYQDHRIATPSENVSPPAIEISGKPAVLPTTKTPRAAGETSWWFEGDDVILVMGSREQGATPLRVIAVIDTIEGKNASVATHPGRAAALAEGKDIKGFESNGLFFVEVSKLGGLNECFVDAMSSLNTLEPGSLTLPAARYMDDDVPFFTPPDCFVADKPSATPQRARKQAPTRDLVPLVAPPTFAIPAPAPPSGLPAAAAPAALPNAAAAVAAETRLMPPLAVESPKAAKREIDLTLPPVAPLPPVFATTPRDQKGAAAGSDPDLRKARVTPKRDLAREKPKELSSAQLLGLDGIHRVVGRWGFQGKALLTDVRIEAPMPHKGILKLFDHPSFRKDHLPPMPRGARAFLVGTFDPDTTCDALVSLAAGMGLTDEADNNVTADEFFQMIELVVFQATGQRLREDLLGHFGPTWCLYTPPNVAKGKELPSMPTLLADVEDPKAFGKVLDSLAKRLNAQLRALQKGFDVDAANGADDAPFLALERLPAPERGYRLTSPAGISLLGEDMEPTILVGKSHVVIAPNPTSARGALATVSKPAEQWSPAGELARAFECLPENLISLSVGDSEDAAMPAMMAVLPKLVQHVVSSFEAIEDGAPGSSPLSTFLGLLGVPRPGGFRLKVDPARVPRAETLQALLFPSVLATASDDKGFRIIRREAIPFACVGPYGNYTASSRDGETIAIELRPFLFPRARFEFKHNVKMKERWKFTFGMNGKLAPDKVSND